MSSGAERIRCRDRAPIVCASCAARVRQPFGADLRGGSLNSARSSASGALLERFENASAASVDPQHAVTDASPGERFGETRLRWMACPAHVRP